MEFAEGLSQAHPAGYEFFAEELRECLGSQLVSMFAYGAAFFARPSTWQTDLDFHVVCKGPLSDSQVLSIQLIHSSVLSKVGSDLQDDAWYIDCQEANLDGYPRHLLRPELRDTSWALHRAHLHAGQYLLIEGQDPKEYTKAPNWEECLAGLRNELAFIEEHFEDSAYCALNLVRILFSLWSKNVVLSKYESAQWGLVSLGEACRQAIEPALSLYCGGHDLVDRHSLTTLLNLVKAATA